VNLDQLSRLPQTTAFPGLRVADSSWSDLPFLVPPAETGRTAPLFPPHGVPAIPLEELSRPGPVTQDRTAEGKEASKLESPSPECAGLLTGRLPFGLEAVERAVRALLEPDSGTRAEGSALLHWLGLPTGLLGAALICAAARWRYRQDTLGLRTARSLADAARPEGRLP
jgi:hypothetical protein